MIDKEKLIKNWDNLEDETKTKILDLADKEIKEDWFVPKEGEVYFYHEVDSTTILSRLACYCDSYIDKYYIRIGNVFRTTEEAIFAGKCDYFTKLFETYVNRHSDMLDWGNDDQSKHYAFYVSGNKRIDFDDDFTYITQGAVYASSEQILKDAIAYVGKDNFLKYVMKVEKN